MPVGKNRSANVRKVDQSKKGRKGNGKKFFVKTKGRGVHGDTAR